MPKGRNLLAAALGTLVALIGAEAGVRLLWRDAPAASAARDDLPLEKVRDPEVLYRLVPSTSGFFNGTAVEVNSLGLRDRDYAVGVDPGVPRLLVLGDSMIFGVGVPPPQTLPGHLSRILAPAEAINAGIFGYNQVQETSLLRDLAPVYRPDLIVSCFVHNDIENWGIGPGGGSVPEIKSSRFEPPPADAWSSRLASLLLPATFDPDRLNLLPAGGGGGLRGFLAAHSRLYLFAYLRLRTHSWSMAGGETRDPLVASRSCEARRQIWRPLREGFRRQARIARDSGARYMVVILNGQLWRGIPLGELGRLLAGEEIPFLDLTPVWGDRQTYAREYTLGWDPHPNGRANSLAAGLVADYIRTAGLLSDSPAGRMPGPHDPIASREDLSRMLPPFIEAQEEAVRSDRELWTEQTRNLPGVIDFGEEPSPGHPRVLYGFWPEGAGVPARGAGRWMSAQGALMLGRSASDSRLVVEVTLPAGQARRLTPRSVDITLSLPPDGCDLYHERVPLDESGDSAVIELEIPPALIGSGPLEVRMEVDHPYRATYLDPGGAADDPRLLSLLIGRIRLMPPEESP